ncbi:MAG: hypothetical protein ACLUNQ_01535 [Oscillospiraceae bacterium]
MAHNEAIIQSMTPLERENPQILNASRKKRIAAGCGLEVVDVNRLLKQFEMLQQMTKADDQGGGMRPGRHDGRLRRQGGPEAPCTVLAEETVEIKLEKCVSAIAFNRYKTINLHGGEHNNG